MRNVGSLPKSMDMSPLLHFAVKAISDVVEIPWQMDEAFCKQMVLLAEGLWIEIASYPESMPVSVQPIVCPFCIRKGSIKSICHQRSSWFPWGMVIFKAFSSSLCCLQAMHLTLTTVISTLIKESPCS